MLNKLHTKACPNGDFGACKDTFFIVITNRKGLLFCESTAVAWVLQKYSPCDIDLLLRKRKYSPMV